MATHGYGTTIKYGDADPAATPLGQITSEPRVTETTEEADVSNHDSTAGWKDFLPGLTDVTLEFECLFLKTRQTIIAGLRRTVKHWLVTIPDGSTIKFQGFITSFGTASPLAGGATNTVSIRVTGAVTFTAAA